MFLKLGFRLLLTSIALTSLSPSVFAQVKNSPADTTQWEVAQSKQQSKQPKVDQRSYTLSNDNWTITIGNTNSWSGVNGTGNLTYRGCDTQNRCLNLTGGRVTCRDGICRIGWRNRDYSYVLEEPMDNPDLPTAPGSRTVLIVRKGAKVILRATGFTSVANHR
ncbi:hypothetical protein ACKFKG_17960 [Phormidesmis sp. 146-35]